MNRFVPLRKLMHVDEAIVRFSAQPGTVFVDGVFDAPHRGQVAFLAEARQLGERRVVAIHRDSARAAGQVFSPNREGDRLPETALMRSGGGHAVAPPCAEAVPAAALVERLGQPGLPAALGEH